MVSTLGEYLRLRRAQVRPADAGLPDGGRRKVAGLRRDEVAALSGVSADYYARLEQGRERHPSASVLDALARTLRLSDDGRRYLVSLAAAPQPPFRPNEPDELTLRLVSGMPGPAVLLDNRHTIVSATDVGAALFTADDVEPQPNLARLIFIERRARELLRDWAEVAASTVAALRHAMMNDPQDAVLTAFVSELLAGSSDFAVLWALADVAPKTTGRLRLCHPLVGDLNLDYVTLCPAICPSYTLKAYTAADGPTAERLTLLAMSTGGKDEPPRS